MSMRYDPPEPPEVDECPQCGEALIEDKVQREVECPECGYSNGYDWDAEAERRAEARYDY
jgi:transposase